jgi:hypothetical protein
MLKQAIASAMKNSEFDTCTWDMQVLLELATEIVMAINDKFYVRMKP